MTITGCLLARPIAPEIEGDRRFGIDLEAARPMLASYARRLTRDADRASDLTQEALLRAWNGRSGFDQGSNFRGWLLTILRNLFLSAARRASREAYLADYPALEVAVQPSQEHAVMIGEVAAAWDRLTHDDQRILLGSMLEGRSLGELAECEGVALGTVKSRIARARTKLKRHCEDGAGASAAAPAAGVPMPAIARSGTAGMGPSDEDRAQIVLLREWRSRRHEAQ